jgi:hypothetical protein
MKNRFFSKIRVLTFYIGVNIIGIPDFVEHKLAIYVKTEKQIGNCYC